MGEVQSELWLINAVSARLPQNQLVALSHAPRIQSVVQDSLIKTAADVKRTPNPMVWEVESPVSVEVGATELHGVTRTSVEEINGAGITVAVIDTGVAFNEAVVAVMGEGIRDQFKGQADFVGAETVACTHGAIDRGNYCWSEAIGYDPYGHGSHVAGVIWNQFIVSGHDYDWGVAPAANILSIRVLGDDGAGTYTDVIEGIQFAVEKRSELGVRVINLSLLAYANTPYFIDPVNRAVEAAWHNGIVVVAAAGNNGPSAETITVPGNDPYIITVGAYSTAKTMNAWDDDTLPDWSSAGPTRDGFIKPDILAPGANVVSYMYNSSSDRDNIATLARLHPDYAADMSLYRLNGTSMATGVASGVVALMLQQNPTWQPDEVKFRLMYSARSAVTDKGKLIYNVFQQGSGRLWAPDAVLGTGIPNEKANVALNLENDLKDEWLQKAEVPTTRMQSDLDGDGVSNTAPACLNKDILFIGSRRPLVPRDQILAERLTQLGFQVVIRNQYESRTSDAQDKALVIISDSAWSPWINTKYRSVATPVLTWGGALYDDLGMTTAKESDYGVSARHTAVQMFDRTHPIANSFSGTVAVTADPTSFFWGKPGTEATKIAVLPDKEDTALIFAYESGAQMVGLTAPGRRIGFPNGIGARFTEEGWQLFLSAVQWGADCLAGSTVQMPDLDSDNDGIPDTVEMATALGGDTDNDGIPDNLDLDSDHDGIWDLHESGISVGQLAHLDANFDGQIDLAAEHQFGANGLLDTLETTPDSGVINYTLADLDADDIPDFQGHFAHYAGPVQRATSDDGRIYLYYAEDPSSDKRIFWKRLWLMACSGSTLTPCLPCTLLLQKMTL
ncbi:MAG: S8 family serine peptidase [Caldilineaceae bacterium]